MEKTTQRNEVLNYLKEHKTITSLEAIERFGATRLADIIYNFRKRGHLIETIDCAGKTRYGDTCVYAKYKYIEFNGKDNTIAVQKMRGEK